MKKLLFTCLAVFGFCALGQMADAGPYGHHSHYYERGYHGRHFSYHGDYGCYPRYGSRHVFFDEVYCEPPPPPVYYCPPPRPTYYEGRIESGRDYQPRTRGYDYGK